MAYDKEKQFTFKENKESSGLVVSLRKMAQKANRRLNDYLNIVLAQHVKDHNETNED